MRAWLKNQPAKAVCMRGICALAHMEPLVQIVFHVSASPRSCLWPMRANLWVIFRALRTTADLTNLGVHPYCSNIQTVLGVNAAKSSSASSSTF